jgi:hypothetical protein
VPADLREALGAAAPQRVPELDFDRLWRRHRRARTRRAVTGVAAVTLLAVLVTVSLDPGGPTVDLQPAEPPADAFLGDWVSVDLDGSDQRLTIRNRGDGTYDVELVDDSSTACGGDPATATGTGRLASPTRLTVTQVYRCADGRVLTEVEGIRLDAWFFAYDPISNTLTDSTDVVWYRPGDEAPSLDEHATWTVDTPLGTWTWTFVPHGAGATRLWNEAMARRPGGPPGLAADAELPEVAVPQIAGMTWTAWAPEIVPGPGDRRVALVPIEGDIDWAAAYGLHPERDEDDWVWAEWRHGASGTTVELGQGWAPGFAGLDVSLVPGEPGAVEFHDEGELVLRLEATDPMVGAEQLATSPQVVWALLVDDGDGFRAVDPPWQRLPVSSVAVAAVRDGFMAAAADPGFWGASDGTSRLHLWTSLDGESWEAVGPPLPLAVEGAIAEQLIGDDGGLLLRVTDRREQSSIWASADGVDWQQVGPRVAGGGWTWLWGTQFGWTLTDMRGACAVWVSADGVNWAQVPFQPEVESRRDVEAVQCSVLGDNVYIQLETQARTDDQPFEPLGLWIGGFER